jgi:ribosomal protein L21E
MPMNVARKEAMVKVSIIKFLYTQPWGELEGVFDQLKNTNQIENFYQINTDLELLETISKIDCFIIVAQICTSKDFSQIVNFLKNNRRALKNSKIKFVVLNSFQNKQFEATLIKMGCTDVLIPQLKEKNIKYKFDIWLSSLQMTRGENKEKVESEIKFLSPIENINDIWMLRSNHDVKKFMQKGFIKVVGPGPKVAQWEKIKEDLFELKLDPSFREKIKGFDCTWQFQGLQKPDFLWDENIWYFAGEEGRLFIKEEPSFEKFKIKNGEIFINQNSKIVVQRQIIILDTFSHSGHNESTSRVKVDLYEETIKIQEQVSDVSSEMIESPDLKIYFKGIGSDHSVHYIAKLDDLEEGVLTLKTMISNFNEGEDHQVFINMSYLGKSIVNSFKGRVKQVFPKSGEVYVTFEISDKDQIKLTPLMNILEQRQEMINQFFQKVKGY